MVDNVMVAAMPVDLVGKNIFSNKNFARRLTRGTCKLVGVSKLAPYLIPCIRKHC